MVETPGLRLVQRATLLEQVGLEAPLQLHSSPQAHIFNKYFMAGSGQNTRVLPSRKPTQFLMWAFLPGFSFLHFLSLRGKERETEKVDGSVVWEERVFLSTPVHGVPKKYQLQQCCGLHLLKTKPINNYKCFCCQGYTPYKMTTLLSPFLPLPLK